MAAPPLVCDGRDIMGVAILSCLCDLVDLWLCYNTSAADAIADSDIANRYIRGKQQWSLLNTAAGTLSSPSSSHLTHNLWGELPRQTNPVLGLNVRCTQDDNTGLNSAAYDSLLRHMPRPGLSSQACLRLVSM